MIEIQMVGIDHNTAPLAQREKFSFTKSRVTEAVQTIAQLPEVDGCVMLSTCNRMEVYVSGEHCAQAPLYETLCALKQLDADAYRPYFVHRSGEEAVRHLYALAAGMQSRIMGEDQIILQVKEALSQARDAESTDKVLEVLFRMAVTAAKKVKTEVLFHKANSSAIASAIRTLQADGHDFTGKTCLVIGNGEMGKLTATALREQGAEVTVTVRQYRSGIVQIPSGCHRINYGERYGLVPSCDYIVSATASPNLTIRRAELETLSISRPQVYIDLAVPRDIEPEVGDLPYAQLYDIDSFASGENEDNAVQIVQANEILRAGIEEFLSWYECKDFVPEIQRIAQAAAQDIVWRSGRVFSDTQTGAAAQNTIEREIETASAKVVSRLLFSLRDSADPKTIRACLDAFLQAYPEAEQ